MYSVSKTPAPLEPGQGANRHFATWRSVMALILREMSTRYGQNPGGYIWAVLEPLGAIVVLSLAFSLMMRSPSLGNSFILFYATGYLPFSLYQTLSNNIARAISFSKALLFYPSVTWVDAILARFLLNALTGLLVAYLLLTGILMVIDTRVVLDLAPMVLAMGLTMLLGLGIGTLNCALGGIFPTWDLIWSIATRPLFIASGIFFTMEDLPRSVQDILWYNPLIHITGIMRRGFFPMYSPQYVSVLYVLAIALVTLVLGLILLGHHHQDILNG
jgi:capsular polysaccharide transport system permease protein